MKSKHSTPHCNCNRRDKVALTTNCIKNVKLRIIKTRTGCQYIGYIYYSENLNWAAKTIDWAECGPRVGHSWSRPSPRFL